MLSVRIGDSRPASATRPEATRRAASRARLGYFRRNHLMPVLRLKDLGELNQHLLEGCRRSEQRKIAGKALTVGEGMGSSASGCCPWRRKASSWPRPVSRFVDGKGCVKVRTNWYSTPLMPGTRVRAQLVPAYVEIWRERECVARHERSFGRYEQVLDLEQLSRRAGAQAGSVGGLAALAAVARARALAGGFRPVVAQPGRNDC